MKLPAGGGSSRVKLPAGGGSSRLKLPAGGGSSRLVLPAGAITMDLLSMVKSLTAPDESGSYLRKIKTGRHMGRPLQVEKDNY